AHGDLTKYKWFFRMAHAEQLPPSAGRVNWQAVPLFPPSPMQLAAMIDTIPWARSLDKQGQVHLLLAGYPLAPLDQAYPVVYQKILGEKVSTVPVAVGPSAATGPGSVDWLSLGGGPGCGPGGFGLPDPQTLEQIRQHDQAVLLDRARGELTPTAIYSAQPPHLLLPRLDEPH